jgi:hypothetical protein
MTATLPRIYRPVPPEAVQPHHKLAGSAVPCLDDSAARPAGTHQPHPVPGR